MVDNDEFIVCFGICYFCFELIVDFQKGLFVGVVFLQLNVVVVYRVFFICFEN